MKWICSVFTQICRILKIFFFANQNKTNCFIQTNFYFYQNGTENKDNKEKLVRFFKNKKNKKNKEVWAACYLCNKEERG